MYSPSKNECTYIYVNCCYLEFKETQVGASLLKWLNKRENRTAKR